MQDIPDSSRTETAFLSDHDRLAELGLVDAPCDDAFDRLTARARIAVDAPIAALSIVQFDRDRQFFKSAIGLTGNLARERQTALSHSFCRLVRLNDKPLVVSDAARDPRVCENPAIRDFGVAAYLGCPVHLRSGAAIGSLCVFDTSSRDWTAQDLATMRELAACADTHVASLSRLTGGVRQSALAARTPRAPAPHREGASDATSSLGILPLDWLSGLGIELTVGTLNDFPAMTRAAAFNIRCLVNELLIRVALATAPGQARMHLSAETKEGRGIMLAIHPTSGAGGAARALPAWQRLAHHIDFARIERLAQAAGARFATETGSDGLPRFSIRLAA